MYEERWDADRDRPYRVLRSTEGWDADRDRSYTTVISTAPRYVERVYTEPTYYDGRHYRDGPRGVRHGWHGDAGAGARRTERHRL